MQFILFGVFYILENKLVFVWNYFMSDESFLINKNYLIWSFRTIRIKRERNRSVVEV